MLLVKVWKDEEFRYFKVLLSNTTAAARPQYSFFDSFYGCCRPLRPWTAAAAAFGRCRGSCSLDPEIFGKYGQKHWEKMKTFEYEIIKSTLLRSKVVLVSLDIPTCTSRIRVKSKTYCSNSKLCIRRCSKILKSRAWALVYCVMQNQNSYRNLTNP